MIKTGKKLAATLLAVAIVVTFMSVLGSVTDGKIGVQPVHAASIYAPNINLERNSISLKVSNPYVGTEPGSIGSWERVIDEATGTKITVMDMWIDAENGPMNDESKFEEGKKYTYQAYVASVTDSGTAPDISTWTFAVLKVLSDVVIDWPDGTVTCDKTKNTILYTAQFTAKAALSRDKGTYTLNLADGKVRVSDEAVINSLQAIPLEYPIRSSTTDFDDEIDLDNDGAYDVGASFGEEYVDCGKLSTTKIKNQIKIKLSPAYMAFYDSMDVDYYGALIIQFDKQANPLTIKPKTATFKYSKLKKKNQTLAVTMVIKFTKKLNDKKTYTLVSAKKGSKSFKKYFKISKTTGKVTIKKNRKMKKGTYKVKVKVKAA